MTTLGALRAEIADDLDRTDLTTRISAAITNAINHYRKTRFYFNEQRTVTFNTVASQSTYTVSDLATIPNVFDLDQVTIEVSGDIRELDQISHQEIELLDTANTGEPTVYSFFNQSYRFYPVPDDAYAVRLIGGIKTAAPLTDVETDNVWMTEAYELIRSRAKLYLAIHVVKDKDMAADMVAAEKDAFDALISETSRKRATGQIRATQF